MNTLNYKKDFPIFHEYPNLVYLDNASTTQKPKQVINALTEFYTKYNANVHRGLYPLSEKATELYEGARQKIAKFLNAEPHEIIFTSGTTASINGIATSLYSSNLINKNPKILISESEHHSNLIPWQQLPNVTLSYIENLETDINSPKKPLNFEFKHDASKDQIYDVLSLNLISNVTGQITDLNKYFKRFNSKFKVLDLAQAVGHFPIDVKELGADFIAFSGHKMYGPMGVGVIWAKEEHLKKLNPFTFGGGMIREVQRNKSSWANIPSKFEAGTPSVADVYALGIATDYIQSIGIKTIQNHEQKLREYLLPKLKQINNIKIYHPMLGENAGGVVSISCDEAHPHDIAQHLGENNICTRAGHHCTQILHREVLHIPASLRISLAIYNSKEDIDKLIEKLKEGMQIYEK